MFTHTPEIHVTVALKLLETICQINEKRGEKINSWNRCVCFTYNSIPLSIIDEIS